MIIRYARLSIVVIYTEILAFLSLNAKIQRILSTLKNYCSW